ncbi:MAG: transporter substrate-binding domain-containing protein [Lachnospiraceae bacterium]|nr:transporter substrate-binding domain-containing protein [Lachnospiraceae bacterium]
MKQFVLKRLGAIVLALTFLVSVLTGCGSVAYTSGTGALKNPTEDTAESVNSTTGDHSDTVYRTVDEIKESGTIHIGVFSDKSPFGYVDENGVYQGYDVYLGNRIGEDLGVEIKYVSTEAANRIEYLQTGKVDIILANFTVTEERAQEVDFALPYMNVALGVVSPDDAVINSLDEIGADDEVIVISGTTAETYLTKNHPDIRLQKYDAYAEAKTAFENRNGVAWANDNTEVIAFAIENPGYEVGIPSLGSADTIAPAVTKGNESLLNWLNDEIKALGEEKFFHAAYEATLLDTYGADYEDTLVVEGGAAAEAGKETADVESKGVITVAASPTPHAEILEAAADILKKEGWTLEVTEFEDYVQPNLVVDSGEIDANYFQHVPYLDDFNEENGTALISVGGIHYEPFGIYPGTKSSLSDLAEGDVIAVPNDTTNEARALLLLQDNGIITLADGAGLKATVKDITDNPKNIKIQELEAAQVSRVKDEVAFVVLNGNYALGAGFSVAHDAVAYETSESEAAKTYVNVLVVKEGNENAEGIQALVKVLKSDEIRQHIVDSYDGAVVPFED